MSRKKPERYKENLKALRHYCDKRGFELMENDNNIFQFRVMGDVALMDVWPSRMKIHVIASEYPECVNDYRALDFVLNEKQLDDLLMGEGKAGR